MKIEFLITVCMVATTCEASFAQIIPLDTAVHTGKLANGFTYYIRRNEEPKNRVVFYLANKVGSVLENEDQRGLAHFMEHMNFNGTVHFPKNQLVDYLQKAGVRFGADINAYTSFDETVYQLPLPSDKPEIIDSGIEIMHDWANGALLDPAEIDKERGVVLEEKRLGKGAKERMQRVYWPVLLNNSRYASRTPIGLDTVLNNFKTETIRQFYHDWYRPDLQALIIVGDIDAKKMEQIVKAKFADLKNPRNERPRPKYTIPLTGKNHFIKVTDPEMRSTSLSVSIKKGAVPLHSVAQYREHIVEDLFNQMMSERMQELSQQAISPFLGGGIGIGKFMANLDEYNVTVTAKPGELESGFKAIWRENERLKHFGFTATELQRAKTAYLKQYEIMLQEKSKTNSESYVQEYLRYFLDGEASPGIAYEYKLVKDDLAGITLDEVNTIPKINNKNTDRDILIMAPEKDKGSLPKEDIFATWMKAVEAEDIKPYKDKISTASLLNTEPVPGKIVSLRKDTNGLIAIALSNGIKVLLKPTNYKNDEIVFSGFAPGGTSLYSDADYESANAANAIPAFGAGNYDRNELTKYLSGKEVSIQTGINELSQNINGRSLKDNLETALQLMYARVTEPRKDPLIFKGMTDRAKIGLANRGNDPGSVFQDTISAVLGNYNIRRTGPSIEKINRANLDKAFAIYKERFANMGAFTFVFVGNIDTINIKPLLEKYIASLPANDDVEQAKDLHIHTPEGVIEKTVYKGLESKATVRLMFSGPFEYSFMNKLKMEALKETLEIRLLERLREDESGVYSPSASVAFSKSPEQRFNLDVSFGCAPQNVDKLIVSTLDEINKLRTISPPQVNVDKFRAENERSIESLIKTNGFWLSYLNAQLQDKEDINEINSYAETLKSITPADVKDIASKYITGKNYIRLVLMPERKN